jgi:hypothetical protein
VTGEEEIELIKVEIKKLRERKEDPKMPSGRSRTPTSETGGSS